MQKFNFHTHTYRCGHADSNMSDEDYVKAHIEAGFEVEYLPGIENDLKELRCISDKIILGQHFVYKDDFSDLKVFKTISLSLRI